MDQGLWSGDGSSLSTLERISRMALYYFNNSIIFREINIHFLSGATLGPYESLGLSNMITAKVVLGFLDSFKILYR